MIGEADVVVIGGGSAGCVLAARLSEDAATRVLLIEAGRDTEPDQVPADIRCTFPASYFNRDYFWPRLAASLRAGEAPVPFLQPAVMGGGSSVMGMAALKGLPSDFDRWERAGATGWGWNDVLPVFQAMTRDLDVDGANQAPRGPNILKRLPRDAWPLYIQRIEQALPGAQDPSGMDDGFFAMPLSADGERATSARCYLTPQVRARSNLTILADTRVLTLAWEERRVCGVVVRRGSETIAIKAKRVAVCAGAVHSPALLLRSGIGPADELRRLGIDVVADRQGIGRNYQNHPQLHFAMTLRKASRLPHAAQRYIIAGRRLSSGLADCPAGDLFHYFTGRVSNRSFGPRMAMVAVALYAPRSRGRVSLRSADPDSPPAVEQNLLSDPLDAQRMILATRHALRTLLDARVRDCFDEIYLMPRQAPLRLINGTGASGLIKAAASSAVLAGPGVLRRAVIGAAIRPGRLVANATSVRPITDLDILDATGTMFHPSATCPIGAADDPAAVADPRCRVYGVDGLSVADASVMPSIVSANTNLPTIMVAERAARFLRNDSA